MRVNGLSTQSIPRFVGRRQTLDSLSHAAEAAVAGRPGVVLLSGPPGQGKTRVLREFVEAARRLGASTYYGRCHEGLAPPYVLFEPLLVALERKSYSANPDLEFDAELIRRIVYRASQPGQVDAEVPTAADRGEQEKLRLFLGIARSTIRLAESRPVVLVLDDLHWADSSSLDLFAHLVDRQGQLADFVLPIGLNLVVIFAVADPPCR